MSDQEDYDFQIKQLDRKLNKLFKNLGYAFLLLLIVVLIKAYIER